MEYYSTIKKNEITDGPEDDHTTWSKSKTNIIWYRLYVECKPNDTNELIYKPETDLENELMVTSGEGWVGGIDWEFKIDRYILLYLK